MWLGSTLLTVLVVRVGGACHSALGPYGQVVAGPAVQLHPVAVDRVEPSRAGATGVWLRIWARGGPRSSTPTPRAPRGVGSGGSGWPRIGLQLHSEERRPYGGSCGGLVRGRGPTSTLHPGAPILTSSPSPSRGRPATSHTHSGLDILSGKSWKWKPCIINSILQETCGVETEMVVTQSSYCIIWIGMFSLFSILFLTPHTHTPKATRRQRASSRPTPPRPASLLSTSPSDRNSGGGGWAA